MSEITIKEYALLKELKNNGGDLGRNKVESEFYDMKHKGFVDVLVSLGSNDWVIKLTAKGEDILEKADGDIKEASK